MMSFVDACQVLRDAGIVIRKSSENRTMLLFGIDDSSVELQAVQACQLTPTDDAGRWVGTFPGPGQTQYEMNRSLEELVDVMCQFQKRLVSNPQLTLRDVFPDVVENADCYMT